jgi:hypothetical protein
MKGYTAVLGILVAVLVGMLFLRNDVEATILRLPGQLYEMKGEYMISNVYTYKIVNKTVDEIEDVEIKLIGMNGKVQLVSGSRITIPGQELAEGTLFVEIDRALLEDDRMKIRLGVYSGEELIETTTTSFLGPHSYR